MSKWVSLFLLFVLGSPIVLVAQQMPQFSMYIWNNYLINPAIGGAENSLDVKLGYRNQWVGLEGAPRTMYLTVHTQLGKRLQNDEDIDVPLKHGDHRPYSNVQRALKYKKKKLPKPPSSYKARGHHGVGFQIMNDRIGPFNVNMMLLSYSYHLPLGKNVYASLGTYMGFKNYNLNTSFISLTDVNDNAIGNQLSSMVPDGTLGGLVYGDRFYGGFSVNQIMNYKLQFSDIQAAIQGRLARHYYLYGGYKIRMPNNDFTVVPSIMIRHLPNTRPSIDLNAKFNYMDVLWTGFSYRHKDSFIGMLGFHFANQWDLGYSYDFTTSALTKYNSGTHEVILGYRLINKKTTGCKPSYVW
ncbi:MAG TPA: type IX secretion system membrane protein PorP/SprF [Cytophagaceae bacterium]|jgi:type IX secretion system PorP/SprF family membrane protein